MDWDLTFEVRLDRGWAITRSNRFRTQGLSKAKFAPNASALSVDSGRSIAVTTTMGISNLSECFYNHEIKQAVDQRHIDLYKDNVQSLSADSLQENGAIFGVAH